MREKRDQKNAKKKNCCFSQRKKERGTNKQNKSTQGNQRTQRKQISYQVSRSDDFSRRLSEREAGPCNASEEKTKTNVSTFYVPGMYHASPAVLDVSNTINTVQQQ